MKRYEVRRHLMHSDLPRTHPLYWFLSGVASKRVNACVGLSGSKVKRTQTTSSIFSFL